MEETPHSNNNNGRKKKFGKKDKTNIGDQKVDRVSALLDELLVEILSLLSLKTAASTSVLSHSWRHLWTHRNQLVFNVSKDSNFVFSEFAATVDHILRQLACPKLDSFTLLVQPKLTNDEVEVFSSFLESWIPLIYARNPDYIALGFCQIRIPSINLPSCFFPCSSLNKLDLIDCNWVYSGIPISLPNLRSLYMSLYNHQVEFFVTLVKSCPLLQKLNLCFFLSLGHVVDISAPNLKFLDMFVVVKVKGVIPKFVIDAPKLEHIYVRGSLVEYDFANKPATLLTAEIDVLHAVSCNNEHDKDSCHGMVSRLLDGVSCARCLLLIQGTRCLFDCLRFGVNDVVPNFHNLTHLWMANPPSTRLPASMLGKLKKISIVDLEGIDDELKLLEDIRRATVLEHLVVFVRCKAPDDQLCSKFTFMKRLFMLAKSLSSCQVEISGNCLSASSDGFDMDYLFVEIKLQTDIKHSTK